MQLLRVDSARGAWAVTRQLTMAFCEAWLRTHPGGRVMTRDLAENALPHITNEHRRGQRDQRHAETKSHPRRSPWNSFPAIELIPSYLLPHTPPVPILISVDSCLS